MSLGLGVVKPVEWVARSGSGHHTLGHFTSPATERISVPGCEIPPANVPLVSAYIDFRVSIDYRVLAFSISGRLELSH